MARQLDFVLIHPGNRTQIYQSLGSSLSAIETPVWASLMATFVRKRGFSVQVLDAEAEDLTPETTATRIDKMDPLLTAVVVYGHQPSASTQNMTAAGAICTALKQMRPDRKVLLVGGHVAALPERRLFESAGALLFGKWCDPVKCCGAVSKEFRGRNARDGVGSSADENIPRT